MTTPLDPFDVRKSKVAKVLRPIELAPGDEIVALAIQEPVGVNRLIATLTNLRMLREATITRRKVRLHYLYRGSREYEPPI